MYHIRTKCPARDVTCNKCGRRGNFSKVCKSNSSVSTPATLYNPTLLAVTAAFPQNFSHTATEVNVNGQKINACIDSCSSDTFINEHVAQRLNLSICPEKSEVLMAKMSLNTSS